MSSAAFDGRDKKLLCENLYYMYYGVSYSVVSDCVQPHKTTACQASPSMGFSRQEYWSGLPCPPPGDLLDAEIQPRSLALQADSLPSEPLGCAIGTLPIASLRVLSRNMH